MHFINSLKTKLRHQYIRTFLYPKAKKRIKKIHCCSVNDTIKNLVNSNKSLTRFGDGEMRRVINKEDLRVQKADRFEKNSTLLREKLITTLTSNLPNLEIGIDTIYNNFKNCNWASQRFCKLVAANDGIAFMKYLNKDKQYYNMGFSRFYIGDFKHRKKDKQRNNYRFNLIKRIWNNKDVLIVEGNECRTGLNTDLFDSAKSISRIECPATNAFESYNSILQTTLKYLKFHPDTLTLAILGPSATILTYDLARKGYRAIDIGQLDIEYNWYLMGAKHRVNIPDRYISEVDGGNSATPIHNRNFYDEIISNID